MSERIQQVKRTHNNGEITQSTTRVTDNEVQAPPPSTIAKRTVWYIAGVIMILLALRFVLVLLGANKGNGFVDLIYTLSYPFAVPFFSVFGYNIHYGVSRFELSTLFAIAIYALVAWGIARLFTIRQPQS